MELTRRDAAAALAALGATGGIGLAARRANGGANDPDEDAGNGDAAGNEESLPDDETVRASMTAVAAVVYPDELTGVDSFVDRFLAGRLDGSNRAAGLREAVAALDDAGRSWHGAPVAKLSESDRDELLREAGADTAEEDRDGTLAERVRYHVVNELLLALYASPTGGELVGLENPQGHPGGTESYRRGPS